MFSTWLFLFEALAAFILPFDLKQAELSLLCPAALYGVLFPRSKEAAFANYRMWESLGFVIAFAYSTFLCLEYKIYILLAVLVLTVITYPIVEYYEYKHPTEPIEESTYQSHKETIDKETKTDIISQTQM